MKYLIVILLAFPCFGFGQSNEKEPSEKLGPNRIFYVDSVKLTRKEFLKFDPNTIASLTVLTDTDATNKFGADASDGVILIQTKAFARKHYLRFFRSKSHSFDSLYTISKSDTSFQYIINDKVKVNNYEGDLAAINDEIFMSLQILTADQLKKSYNITDKQFGIVIRCSKPKNLFNSDSKF